MSLNSNHTNKTCHRDTSTRTAKLQKPLSVLKCSASSSCQRRPAAELVRRSNGSDDSPASLWRLPFTGLRTLRTTIKHVQFTTWVEQQVPLPPAVSVGAQADLTFTWLCRHQSAAHYTFILDFTAKKSWRQKTFQQQVTPLPSVILQPVLLMHEA